MLSGCSAVRLGYNNGTSLAAWWLDDYLDLDRNQDQQLRVALDEWFIWHRSSQLPDYADALREIGRHSSEPVSAAQVCAWTDAWRNRLDKAVEHALPAAARLLPEVGAAQWATMRRQLGDKNAELRAAYLAPDKRERDAAAMRRATERAESLYGELREPQRKLLAAARADSPFDPARWLAEREKRQSEWLAGLVALQSPGVTPARRVDAMREFFARTQASPDPQYREYQRRVTTFNCQLAAQLHNAADAAQREHLRQRLAAWEEDFRALAKQAAAASQ